MERLSGAFFKNKRGAPRSELLRGAPFFFCGKERACLCGSSIKIRNYFFTSCVNGAETCVNEDCRGGGYGMMEVRRRNDSRTSVLLSERKDTMKRFTRFAALLLIGALALALLAGCGTSDIAKKKALLTALQSAAQSPENEGYTVIEDNVLAAEKTDWIFAQFKQAGYKAYDEAALEKAYQSNRKFRETDDSSYAITCDAINDEDQYGVILIEMPKNPGKTSVWNKAGDVIFASMWGYKAYGAKTLTVAVSVIKDAKLTEDQQEPKDYMLVFAKQPMGEDGGGIGGGDGEEGGGIVL